MNKLELFFKKIIDLKWYVVILFGIVSLAGFYCLQNIKIDAIPDITNKQVIINTKTGAIDPDRIEKAITYPIESELYGIPNLIDMRSISKFGLSQIVLIFDDSVNIYFAREQVLQRLSNLKDELPQGVAPTIAPLTTGIGEILMYRVYNPNGNNDLMALRTVQEYIIARELKKVRGVADVDTLGGFDREIHLNIDPKRLTQYGMTPEKLIEQIQTVGENSGGGYIEKDDKQVIVRTYPNIKNYTDIMDIPVKLDYAGNPVSLKNIANVRQDYSQRLGAATYNGDEAVIGTVMLQSGENAREVLSKVKEQIIKLNNKNADVKIEILYDRQFLIDSTIKTVVKNLSEGILLVIGVLCLLLGNLRTGLVVAISIPFCILILSICMRVFGISANLMSLGALDFGLLVDSSVVLVERIVSGLTAYRNREEKTESIAKLVASVAKPVAFGITIIILVYVPILMFSGIEGKTFKPMAINIVIAMVASVVVAFLLMPVLSSFFISNNSHGESKLFAKLLNIYSNILDFVFSKSKFVIAGCVCFFVLALGLFCIMPSDFLPELNEGDVVYTIVTDEGMSLTKTREIVAEAEKEILKNQAIEKTFARIGTSQTGLDPMPQNSADIFVILKHDHKKDAFKVSAQIYEELKKTHNEYKITESQPIKMRFNEMLEGSRADISLKIFGSDLGVLMKSTNEIIELLEKNANVKEVEGDFINSIRKTSTIDIVPDYKDIIRYQVSISGMNSDLANAMGGFRVGSFYATEFPISVVMHIDEGSRNRVETIRSIPVGLADGGSFPISKIAAIKEGEAITSIPRIFGERYSGVSIYLKNTDYADFIHKTEKQIKENNILPQGYSLEWGGRFENLTNARVQIFTVVPIILLTIFGLLYKMFGSIRETLIIFVSIPFAISGGIVLLFICKIPITISVYIGFIALIGISLLNSIILLDTVNKSHDVKQACLSRLRPILMTALVASLGFVPMAFGHGIGAEVQQPIAITVIGGIISSTIATLALTPILVRKGIH